jgi:hypothetical protein
MTDTSSRLIPPPQGDAGIPPGAVRWLFRLAALAVLLTAVACGKSRAPGQPSPDGAAGLEVRNLGYPDMTIYAVTSTGNRVRLGLVTGHSTQRLSLPDHLVRGGDRLRFLADPIGGSRTPVSEELYVGPGELVTLTIPP